MTTMRAHVGEDTTEVLVHDHGTLVYSQSLRLGRAAIARSRDEALSGIVEAVSIALARVPAELAGAVAEHGVFLEADGAPLYELAERLRAELRVPITISIPG